MHGKVALWEEKQNGFEILMRYNMIQCPLRNTREGLHDADLKREPIHAHFLYLAKYPRNHHTLYPAAGAGCGNNEPQPFLLQCNFMKFIKTSLATQNE